MRLKHFAFILRFPNVDALQLLLACGYHWLDLDAVTKSGGNTPLHVACQQSAEPIIIKSLVNAGAHIDCINKSGRTPMDYTKNKSMIDFLSPKVFPHRLKCLCSRLLIDRRLHIDHQVQIPLHLRGFVSLHDSKQLKSD